MNPPTYQSTPTSVCQLMFSRLSIAPYIDMPIMNKPQCIAMPIMLEQIKQPCNIFDELRSCKIYKVYDVDNTDETTLMLYCKACKGKPVKKDVINYLRDEIGYIDKDGNTALSHLIKCDFTPDIISLFTTEFNFIDSSGMSFADQYVMTHKDNSDEDIIKLLRIK